MAGKAQAADGPTHAKIKVKPDLLHLFILQPSEESQYGTTNRDEPGYAAMHRNMLTVPPNLSANGDEPLPGNGRQACRTGTLPAHG